jgi:hypothetical protein
MDMPKIVSEADAAAIADAVRARRLAAQNGGAIEADSKTALAGGYIEMAAMVDQLRGAQAQVHNRVVGGATPLSDAAAAAAATSVEKPGS